MIKEKIYNILCGLKECCVEMRWSERVLRQIENDFGVGKTICTLLPLLWHIFLHPLSAALFSNVLVRFIILNLNSLNNIELLLWMLLGKLNKVRKMSVSITCVVRGFCLSHRFNITTTTTTTTFIILILILILILIFIFILIIIIIILL